MNVIKFCRGASAARVGRRAGSAAGLFLLGLGVAHAGIDISPDRGALMRGHRGGTLRLSSYQPSGTIDPQINYESDFWQIFAVTQDGLVTFAKAEDQPGMTVVPDLADALPTITDGGLTYRFHLRPGLRFSTGQTIGVEDVLASFRRMFKVSGPNVGSWYNILVGADACLATPATCTLAGGVQGDAATGMITLHLTRPDAEFSQKLALPFASILPAGTPPADLGTTPPAATGPYMIASYNPVRAMVLVRNPYFHQWSEAAQPDGFVDSITIRYGLMNEAEITAIENGSLDWTSDPAPLDRLAEIGARFTSLAHIHPLLAYYYLMMNTRIPPFTDARARRAVAFAINRRLVVNLYGGPALGTPICQLLPQGIAGHVAYCPFTLNPGASWSAPDLAQARALVKASGTAGQKVTIVSSDRDIERAIAIYLQSVLNDIGYQASIHSISFNIRDTYLQNSSNRVQIGLTDWYQDYPSPSDFLNVLLSCASFHPGSDASINMSAFCDPGIDARMQQAMQTQSAADWAGIDHDLTDLAPLTTLFQIHRLDVVSARLGHFRFSPLVHMIFSEVWVQ